MMMPVDYYFKFHSDFYNPIIDGDKISTIRDESKPVDIDDIVIGYFQPVEKVCLLSIDDHYAKKFKDLCESQAEDEGYQHPDLLKHELKNIYPDLDDDDYVYIYQFTVVKEHENCPELLRDIHKNEGI